MSPDIAKHPLEAKPPPAENHCLPRFSPVYLFTLILGHFFLNSILAPQASLLFSSEGLSPVILSVSNTLPQDLYLTHLLTTSRILLSEDFIGYFIV